VEDDGMLFGGGPPSGGSNMVLRKRIRRIKQGMKKYNDQLVEVKTELKSCKSKLETQSKQASEYAQRLNEYDKKFEDNSKKFQGLLAELNKCKTELQFWRSKAAAVPLDETGKAQKNCMKCEAPLTLGDLLAGVEPSTSAWPPAVDLDAASDISGASDLRALANQGVYPSNNTSFESAAPEAEPEEREEEPANARALRSGPPSPASPGTSAGAGRKRGRAKDDDPGSGPCRKSLRGAGVKNRKSKPGKAAAN